MRSPLPVLAAAGASAGREQQKTFIVICMKPYMSYKTFYLYIESKTVYKTQRHQYVKYR
jgi:hypothetical protein